MGSGVRKRDIRSCDMYPRTVGSIQNSAGIWSSKNWVYADRLISVRNHGSRIGIRFLWAKSSCFFRLDYLTDGLRFDVPGSCCYRSKSEGHIAVFPRYQLQALCVHMTFLVEDFSKFKLIHFAFFDNPIWDWLSFTRWPKYVGFGISICFTWVL